MTAPGLIISAPSSGAGKTTVALGLMRALTKRGLRVRGLKSGPDYIDPAFHRAATGQDSYNLDSFAMPPKLMDGIAASAAAGQDILIAEGAMGLFDGARAPAGRRGAAADLARRYGWPVVLVIDCRATGQTAAAVALGLARFDPEVRTGGVILNNVASERHLASIRDAFDGLDLPLLGVLPRDKRSAVPERHLGLVQAEEIGALDEIIDRLAAAVESHCDIARIAAIAGGRDIAATGMPLALAAPGPGRSHMAEAERLHTLCVAPAACPGPRAGVRAGACSALHAVQGKGIAEWVPDSPSGFRDDDPPICDRPAPGRRIAIARDAAFSFIYPHLLAGWQACGAEAVFFSPLKDEPPPPDCNACFLPGGYPELHAAKLSAARNFMTGLRAFAAARPVYGECGGYMALGQALIDADGLAHEMAGLLPLVTSFAARRLTLGYRRATLTGDAFFGGGERVILGHEFHYATTASAPPEPREAFASFTDAEGKPLGAAGHRAGNVAGSFFHAIAQAQTAGIDAA
jgi:cobyrinic acid a,c-diamide synthase